ncbi:MULTISPECIES: quinone-dependent dihydroorotate dehydrogenase [Legionella]|uniref:Dihydroorotate dehydrogenase (quinone) n=1 Tax=Legionella septentrionalis TaxID=2498109 RepID=A0A3S0WS87_9GAMM|nr:MULTISPECIES: quinone-dependent dihydroorotate dehydrogenase [Legionella]MCP0914215.1 quinone-dependent dihydroorotate dehydrogenase [Legionella sp. 27cVA30]RUQ89209.1 quinone-dependent dihydroorotate dehydrogenase [Legionella septentrionalis]RUR00556.1 quinone-dependent dihydroorotate dehydrogenase [Legionella septentrionalis]RUR11757.1 quinone-dependent dihydroorotate dehydrogenase [Legionella septentrionalis]RUR17445.1 quinone-dependent dihydroorotate dehydrogenase [Legionella septentrio
MYSLLKHLLFCLEPERAHRVALSLLHYSPAAFFPKPLQKPVEVLGLSFPHPLGLAAGFDKNGEHLAALAKLGFSFIEVGTVTPKPQPGNPKPRLFRLPKAQALINRMGFNNGGVDALVENIKKTSYQGILGINLGKNKDTPLAQAADDYLYGLRKVYAHASYVTVNISSPNTPDLRQLQQGIYFNQLISALREEQLYLADLHQRYVPLLIKLSPDETDEELKTMADAIVSCGIDGIIATNTTCTREAVKHLPHAEESGGLSGCPLAKRSTECLRVLKQIVGDEVTLIAAGGIDSAEVAQEKLAAGASLLQIYTGLIYQGPRLIKSIVDTID